MPDPYHILVSSSGRRGALLKLCRRALEEMERGGQVFAADITQASAAYQLADAGFYATRFDDPQYIPMMLDVCREQGVKLVIPTHDRELMLYARARDEFEMLGTRVCISSPQMVEIGLDKLRTHDWLDAQGFPVPRQAMAREVQADPTGWAFPVIVKPRAGSASIGVRRVADAEALQRLNVGADDIIQSTAPGNEYTVDVFVDREGVCRCAVPRRRLEVRAGEVSKGVTVRDAAIIDLAKRVAEALPGAQGVLNIQIFYDAATGTLNVIEINPRFGGGYPLAHEAGADMIRWLIEEHTTGRCSAKPGAWRDGLVMLRYDDAVFVDRSQAGLD